MTGQIVSFSVILFFWAPGAGIGKECWMYMIVILIRGESEGRRPTSNHTTHASDDPGRVGSWTRLTSRERVGWARWTEILAHGAETPTSLLRSTASLQILLHHCRESHRQMSFPIQVYPERHAQEVASMMALRRSYYSIRS